MLNRWHRCLLSHRGYYVAMCASAYVAVMNLYARIEDGETKSRLARLHMRVRLTPRAAGAFTILVL